MTTPGDRLRQAVTDLYELDEHELVVLDAAARTADLCAELAGVVDRDGLVVLGNGGVPKMHPAIAELRQQRLTLARLIAALRVPLEDGEVGGGARLQRRPLRGVHGVGGAA